MTILQQINQLRPNEFENLIFDYAAAIGFKNLTWRTPGADGGRDIEAFAFPVDLSGHQTVERWFIECKLYSSSLSWPTIWAKVAHADAVGADVLLLATNSNPSPMSETRISEWNQQNRRPRIRIWRGYDYSRLLRPYPAILAAYALSDDIKELEASLLELAVLQTATAKSLVSSIEFGTSLSGSTVLLHISELMAVRMHDISANGHFVKGARCLDLSAFDWISSDTIPNDFEDVGLLSLLSFACYVTGSSQIELVIDDGCLVCTPVQPRFQFSESAISNLIKLSFFSFLQIDGSSVDADSIKIRPR